MEKKKATKKKALKKNTVKKDEVEKDEVKEQVEKDEVKEQVEKDEVKEQVEEKKDEYAHLSASTKKLLEGEKEKYKGLRLKINTKSKREVMVLGRDRAKWKISRLSTGSFWLDYACGGGVPANRFSMFWGEESTSKTTLALKVMADAQKRHKETYEYFKDINFDDYIHDSESNLYIHKKEDKTIRPLKCHFMDLEGAYDAEWASNLGVDTESIDLSCPETGPEAIDMMRKFINERDKEGFPLVDVLVVDSVAVMTPIDEIEKDADGNAQPGAQARMLNAAWRKFSSDLASIDPKRRPTIILINQKREKIGITFGNPETRPGGNGQKFVTSLEVRTKKGQIACLDKEKKYPLYQEMKGVINKNKTGAPKIEYAFNLAVNNYNPPEDGKDAKYPISFRKGDILEHDDVRKIAVKYGLFGKDDQKNQYYVHLLDQSEPIYYKRQKDLFDEWIFSDVHKYNHIKQDLLLIMSGKI